MSLTTYTSLLNTSESISQEQLLALKELTKQYPYFQSARALYLKGLKQHESFKYNHELKITAAHTMDRSVLFDYITSKPFTEKATIHSQIADKIKDTPKLEVEQELAIGKPLHFSSSETHSFQEWLQLSAFKPIDRKPKKVVHPLEEKLKLIDTFIKENPKISPTKKDGYTTPVVKESEASSSIMTETLAKVYLEQKKYENAIKAYRILSLKYPEKSGFFADQIKRIQILQKHTT